MNATKTEPGGQLTCRHCGAGVAPEQEWCFECGKAVTTRVVPPPSWLLPVGVIVGVVAVVAVAVAIVFTQLEREPERAAEQAPAPAPATPAPAPVPTAPPPVPPPGGGAPRWPRDLEAYTVVLLETRNPAAAEARARSLVARGADAGVLRTDDYESFAPGRWVVWRGRYQRLAKATESLGLLRAAGRNGQIRFVRPRR